MPSPKNKAIAPFSPKLIQRVRGLVRAGRTVSRNLSTTLRYRQFSDDAQRLFGPVLAAYRPRQGIPCDVVRWTMTEWCNFACPYCDQTHDRRASKPGGFSAHAFDNYPLDQWIAAFERHFSKRRVALTLTGGEPMLDVRAMTGLLDHLAQASWCDSIRIDTNASWSASKYSALDKRKIRLNCSYHPSQIPEETYFANLQGLRDAGFQIGMINYVLSRSQRDAFRRFQARVEAMGLVMNVSPEFTERHSFTPEEIQNLEIDILEQDRPYRLALSSPKGKPCLYPALSYEMTAAGYIRVGCMPHLAGSFFDWALPHYGQRVATCPHAVCSCLDKYSFLAEFGRNTSCNPFMIYTAALHDLAQARRTRKQPSDE